jgi:tRNA modification GTPase
MYFCNMKHQDCIAAIATASGIGAVGLIRVSGADSLLKVNALLKKPLNEVESHRAVLRRIFDSEGLIDESLITVFRDGKSYTGENSVEIAYHGSDYIAQRLLKALLSVGIRMADPGEFTQRAFLNGKIDLAQAEAVADVIAAEHKFAHEQALKQLRGGFSKDIAELRDKLLWFVSLIELELDFGEEDVEFASRAELQNLVLDLKQRVDHLRDSFALGNALKKGFTLVLAGRPNAGKSTLFNALLNEDRAIVSDIKGTTRDAIEEVLNLGDVRIRLVDTAGIREASDSIEREGINRTFKHIEAGGATLYLFDPSELTLDEFESDLRMLREKTTRIWVVANKMDVFSGDIQSFSTSELMMEHEGQEGELLRVVAKDRSSVQQLTAELSQRFTAELRSLDGLTVVTNARHADALDQCSKELVKLLEGIEYQMTGDLLSFHLRSGIRALASITGEIDTEEILGNIFSRFCIGK